MIEAADVQVRLDGKEILKDIRLSIPGGTWVGLIGPNGSGKTTLLRAIGGLIAYAGSLQIKGVEVSAWNRLDFSRTVAFVRPAATIAFDFTVFDLVMLGRSSRKKWLQRFDAADTEAATRALESVDLEGFGGRSIHSLSTGEQQRVFLAQAIAQEPRLLLLDEPTAHLDIHHRFSFLDRVRTFVDGGGTAVAAIHDLELACRFADYLLVLNHGRVAAFGDPAHVMTPATLADVFQVRADVVANGQDVTSVRYFGPIESAETHRGGNSNQPAV